MFSLFCLWDLFSLISFPQSIALEAWLLVYSLPLPSLAPARAHLAFRARPMPEANGLGLTEAAAALSIYRTERERPEGKKEMESKYSLRNAAAGWLRAY